MFSQNNPNGYFNDLPYIGPVECSAFFQLVLSSRLHKLSESMMFNPRTIEYFVDRDSKLYSMIEKNDAKKSPKASKSHPYPELKTDYFSTDRFSTNSTLKIIQITESVWRMLDAEVNANLTNVVGLDFCGVQTIWSDLVKFMFGSSQSTNLHFIIPNLDNYLEDVDGVGEFLLSLLLTGVASILNFFVSRELNTEKIEKILLEFTVYSSSRGKFIADTVQFFCENIFHLSVLHCTISPVEKTVSHKKLFESIEHMEEVSSFSDLVEKVRSVSVDKHEDLCDSQLTKNDSQKHAPFILLISPLVDSIRHALRKSLLDSYSYEPITVFSDIEWDTSILDYKTPVIFICSLAWIAQQARLRKHEQLLDKLNIKCVVHCGFTEYALTIDEELIETITLIKMLNTSSFDFLFLRHSTQSFVQNAAYPSQTNPVEVSGNIILLMFRLFMMRYSSISKQPFFTMPRNIFLTERAWRLYLDCVSKLSFGGLLKVTYDHSDWPTVELTVLGRLLSFQFRLRDHTVKAVELSLIEAKIVVWSHLLRQGLIDTYDLIRERHLFKDWIEPSVKHFCEMYKMFFTEISSHRLQSLIRQLSYFGLGNSKDGKRAHVILSSCSGTRVPIQSFSWNSHITTCRGWFDQAPLQTGIILEKKTVDTFCLPPSSLFCEVAVDSRDCTFRVQCPTEVSYPIIVAHSILHISLHNNGIFVESLNSMPPVPLSLSILESHTMLTILENPELNNAGLWLDGVMSTSIMAPSDSSMLVSIILKGQNLIRVCERALLGNKKKSRRSETKENVDIDSNTVFTGVTPRSLSEADTVEELIKLIRAIGREKAEGIFRGKKGFAFLDPNHCLHAYYLYLLNKPS